MNVLAHAKLNLSLDVLSRREDGYHDLCMVMQTVELADEITLTEEEQTGVRVRTDLRYLPGDDRNLAAVAARKFWEFTGCQGKGLSIQIRKSIPVCAGMGGGSADAAAVLRALNELSGMHLPVERLAQIGEQVGSDVPYCVLGGTALAEGRGERLTPLPALPDCHIVICKPSFPISTPELFGCIDCRKIRCRPDTAGILATLEAGDLAGVARRLYNVFEDVLTDRRGAEIAEIKNEMIASGALGAAMSGTGPTVFGIFDSESKAQSAYQTLKSQYPDTFLTRPV
ncbi:MAG: 4-(cytidine 5'-diphospho)-2-C-methyl-D-erythritol kinase [Oscillospiraceae bacterium]